MLLETGWELDDLLFTVIPSIYNDNAVIGVIFSIFHHITLYGLFPVNMYFVGGNMGGEIAWGLFLFAGINLPLIITQIVSRAHVFLLVVTLAWWCGDPIVVMVGVTVVTFPSMGLSPPTPSNRICPRGTSSCKRLCL